MKSNHVLISVEFDSEWCQPPRPWPAFPLLCLVALVCISFPALKFGTLKFVFHFSCSTAFGTEPADENLHSSRVGFVPNLKGDSCPMTLAIFTHLQRVYAVQAELCSNLFSLNACVFLIVGDLIIKTIFLIRSYSH